MRDVMNIGDLVRMKRPSEGEKGIYLITSQFMTQFPTKSFILKPIDNLISGLELQVPEIFAHVILEKCR